MINSKIADIFDKWAKLIEFKGMKDPNDLFRVRAYQKAAQILRELPTDIEDLVNQEKPVKLPGIGEAFLKKIQEFIATETIKEFERARKGIPDGVFEMIDISSIGPKTVKLLHEHKIRSIEELRQATEDGRLAKLPHMKEGRILQIAEGLKMYLASKARMLLGEVLPLANRMARELRKTKTATGVELAGSIRRMKETVGDIDMLATGKNLTKVITAFSKLSNVTKVIATGAEKCSVFTEEGRQVDLLVIPEDEWGSALQHFTGSKQHNVHLRTIAKEHGFTVSEHGTFKGRRCVASRTEEEVYHALGMDWIPPEMREDQGEIELALAKKVPTLIEQSDIKGDFHVHSDYSDGRDSLEKVVQKAVATGYQYVALTDHSPSSRIAHGLITDRLLKKLAEIEKLRRRYPAITLLAGTEVDILPEGSIDYPDEILAKLDFVVASVHSRLAEDVTNRLVRAMENRYVNVIGHPTGRLIGSREESPIDVEKIFKQAAATGTALEVNGDVARMDLKDSYIREGKRFGLTFAIDTDAHSIDSFWQMDLGVGIARRGWLTKKEVLNAQSIEAVRQFVNAKRKG
ncbi:MAG: DNA polymerase/3'-5' exonuclease PolX [Parcubacteria group bacterium]|nr:DNA polymerase/3'-5' exonuclease PolX [Parcubacteria group bacterium]